LSSADYPRRRIRRQLRTPYARTANGRSQPHLPRRTVKEETMTTTPVTPATSGQDRAATFAAMRAGDIGSVHSWELVTAVDGPGTRMTLFMSGCPLRCKYCHNPDTMELREGTLERVEDVIKRVKRYRPVFRASGGGLTISGGEPLFQLAFTKRVPAA